MLVKRFGQKGQGPGDLNSPSDLSILDGRTLVVAHYALTNTLSLWDLDGRFLQMVKTRHPVFYLTALRGQHIAYAYFRQHAEEKNGQTAIMAVVIKNLESGEEKTIGQWTMADRSSIRIGQSFSINVGKFFGQLFLLATGDGELAVGLSNRPEIELFELSGQKKRTIRFDLQTIEVDPSLIADFKAWQQRDFLENDGPRLSRANPETFNIMKKGLAKLDYAQIFDSTLPLYCDLAVSADRNWIVYPFDRCFGDCPVPCIVFDRDGKRLGEGRLDGGEYRLKVDRRFKRLVSSPSGLFGLFARRGDDEGTIRLLRFSEDPFGRRPLSVSGKGAGR